MRDRSRILGKRGRGGRTKPGGNKVLDGNYTVEKGAWTYTVRLEVGKGAGRSADRLAGWRCSSNRRGFEEPVVQGPARKDTADGERPDRHNPGVGANLHGLQQ